MTGRISASASTSPSASASAFPSSTSQAPAIQIRLQENKKREDGDGERNVDFSGQKSFTLTTKILQNLLKRPLFTKDPQKTNEFLHYFNSNIKKYLTNEVNSIQKLLESNQSLNENESEQIANFFKKVGLRVPSADEVNSLISSKYFSGIKVSINGAKYESINLFLSNQKVYEEQNTGFILSFKFIKELVGDKTDAILLCRLNRKNEVVFKCFRDIYYHDLMCVLPQTKVLEPALLKILYMTSLGMTLGSASSYVVSEILHHPSDIYVLSFALMTLLSSFFWTQMNNLKLRHLWYKCDLLFKTKLAEGNNYLNIFARNMYPKIFMESLLVYIFLLKEKDHLSETETGVKIIFTMKDNIKRWSEQELDVHLWEDFRLDDSLKILQFLKLIEATSDSLIHFKVHGLETSSTILSTNHFKLSLDNIFKL
ncbi:hypothetical protein HELRODRAFT_162533 [Helobdella robusta]|uniref:Uncharacterized protein n=1 Tax=Helobdella robusta TaxID=6412 RepID=T1EST2_HELRO|nr:hypothetical protein HELRODRAFT_162533 [Helobdella robusta]ESN99054.1 hypothetical protein HELRODRAFT_162533 [Helobdella robusta]